MTGTGEAAPSRCCYSQRMTPDTISTPTPPRTSSARANALADRLEQGARALIAFASGLTEAEWRMRTPKDGRTVGVIVHHVASVYPLEIQLAQTVAAGKAITGVTMADVDEMNARHSTAHGDITKETAIAALETNSAAAAAAIRELTDEQLAQAAPVSLYADAPVTCQFVLEDHAVRHSYHHIARLRRAVAPQSI
jgi:DinB family protein